MNLKTRQVLALLTDDLAAHILEQCAQRPRSKDDLVTSSASALKTIDTKLRLLEAQGLLTREINHDATAGRPPTRWQPRLYRELAAFERAADAFVLAVIQAQLDEHQHGIDARRARDMQVSKPDTPDRGNVPPAPSRSGAAGGDGE